jgi:hypothetical protein
MARTVIVELVDDYDGKSPAEETVQFSLDGVAYEIDLSASNALQLREVFERWRPHARRVGRVRLATGRPRSTKDRIKANVIREWARNEGLEVSSRGRVSAEVAEAYKVANA